MTDRWATHVQYRWKCDECEAQTMCAVIHRGPRRWRLCHSCYLDGFWRRAAKREADHAA